MCYSEDIDTVLMFCQVVMNAKFKDFAKHWDSILSQLVQDFSSLARTLRLGQEVKEIKSVISICFSLLEEASAAWLPPPPEKKNPHG